MQEGECRMTESESYKIEITGITLLCLMGCRFQLTDYGCYQLTTCRPWFFNTYLTFIVLLFSSEKTFLSLGVQMELFVFCLYSRN
uniref:Uncharacterized protein n=1 Tax=Pyxicephalus adspersus TaxID=30357 RepID=A0AAV3ASV8_PYXAD|nr:TPA: hypothetical protein GDO54_006862 [Pyxicephalus adspersus]